MKILFSVNPGGLGHATRSLAIAELLKKKLRRAQIEIITGNSSAELFRAHTFKVHDLYRFVPYTIINGKMRFHSIWFLRYALRYMKEKNSARKIVEQFKPTLIINDQDLAIIPSALELKIPIIYITDVLGIAFAKNPISQIWENYLNNALTNLINSCDLVLMPLEGKSHGKTKRLGPIVRETKKTREELRKEFNFTKKTILITGGGSEYGEFIVKKAVQAAQNFSDADIVIVWGPGLRKKNYDSGNIREFETIENLYEYIYASDLVITTAGRSTISECLVYGTPFIALPIGNHFEQVPHALAHGFKFEDIYNLENLIEKSLNQPRAQRKSSSTERFADEIVKFSHEIRN
ncbi:TPA: hypothetical protein H1016_03870 [archaeon]|uniref:Glycosyl transferase family 28 C-terminal domain-containing protein n=1 Tax=Candidatus Naiadarchaeum limnaeum TaxID=2756139 RepID=A0A832XIE4_9ARCH|nr:hypothetical protein [Candidatus Naiadarchaeum limnaeum]